MEWNVAGANPIVPPEDHPTPSGTDSLLSAIAASIAGDDAARSLWQRLQVEFAKGGPTAATQYLSVRLKEASDLVTASLPTSSE